MSEENQKEDRPENKGTDFSEYARHRTASERPPRSDTTQSLRGCLRFVLRAFGIMVGVTFLLIVLILGVCFIRI